MLGWGVENFKRDWNKVFAKVCYANRVEVEVRFSSYTIIFLI